MKRNLLFVVTLIVATAAVVCVIVWANQPVKTRGVCSSVHGQSHKVIIVNNKVEPDNTTGKLCDRLTITNMDNLAREIAFGPHEHHVPYDGVAEKVLNQGQSLTITLNKSGNYHFHDHLHDTVQGYFTVKS